jgi:hypothetical protein
MDALIRDIDRKVLAQRRFIRSGRTWNRPVGDHLVDVVEVVTSKSGHSLDVTIGVCDRLARERVWPNLTAPIDSATCVVRIGLDELMGGDSTAWRFDEPAAANVIATALEGVGLDWIEQMHDHEEMIRFLGGLQRTLIPAESVLLALVEDEIGRQQEACLRLEAVQLRALGLWKDRAADLSLELGCQSRAG